MNTYKKLTQLFLGLSLASCSTSLIVVTDPPGAEVFASQQGAKEAQLLGKSPIQIDEKSLAKKLNIDPSRLAFMELTLKKDTYKTERIWMPASGWGSQETTVKFVLEEGEESVNIVDSLVNHLLNAQKFAETRQFEQAHLELNKALRSSPKFAKAMSMKGAIFFLQKQYDQSQTWYKKALDVNPAMNEAVKMLDQINKITR